MTTFIIIYSDNIMVQFFTITLSIKICLSCGKNLNSSFIPDNKAFHTSYTYQTSEDILSIVHKIISMFAHFFVHRLEIG